MPARKLTHAGKPTEGERGASASMRASKLPGGSVKASGQSAKPEAMAEKERTRASRPESIVIASSASAFSDDAGSSASTLRTIR